MKSLSLENVTVLGLLSHRLLRSSMRLESDIYIPDRVCRLDSGGWPADAEGRTLLALIRQMEVTKREPSYLRETLRTGYGNLNEKGYLGEILPPGCFNEQHRLRRGARGGRAAGAVSLSAAAGRRVCPVSVATGRPCIRGTAGRRADRRLYKRLVSVHGYWLRLYVPGWT